MAKTLLDLTQKILSSMDSDQVNNISDTTESQQVARIIQDSYEYLYNSFDFPETFTYFELVPSGNINLPTVMYLPANCDQLVSVRYDTNHAYDPNNHNYGEVRYLHHQEFLERQDHLDRTRNDVDFGDIVINSQTLVFQWITDRAPMYFTTFNDEMLLFDAFDASLDSTLVGNKTRAYGKLSTTFLQNNTFVPPLSDKQFQLLLNEAKSQAFIELKQQNNPISERRARKGWIRNMKHGDTVKDPWQYYSELPNYGRTPYYTRRYR